MTKEPLAAPGDLVVLDKGQALELGLVSRLYREVLEPSFPPEELGEPWAQDYVPEEELLVAADRQARSPLGCAIVEHYQPDVTLLGYLAVKPGDRGQGIGSALMSAVLERLCQPGTLPLAEVDDPRHHQAHHGYGDPWARLRFYQRFGFEALAAPYFQPSLGKGYPRAYHMMLCRFYAPGAPREDAVSGERVRAFLEDYFSSEPGHALADPEVSWLLSFYTGDVGLVPLSELERVPDPDPPFPPVR